MREFRDPYIHTMMEIEASTEYTDAEKAALIQQVIDAVHLVMARRPKYAVAAVPAARREAAMPAHVQGAALKVRWNQHSAGVCYA